MTRRIVLLVVLLAGLAFAYELGWETGATQMIEHEVESSA